MANYDWRDHQERPWWERFPHGVRGREFWLQFVESGFRQEGGFDAALRQIAQARHTRFSPLRPAKLRRPCVFVSHRKDDVDEAERIAWLACQKGYDYWLDIYDPSLGGYPGAAHATVSEAKVVALTIEMALLNSTHVVAVITANTPGSAWVPYEYGRVKDPVPNATQAACWMSPAVTVFPEYLHLGEILRSESMLQKWLEHEGRRFNTSGACSWPRSTPRPL